MTGAASPVVLADFFGVLYPPGFGFTELRALPSKAQAFIKRGDMAATERFCRQHSDQNIFFGVAARQSAGDGSLVNCGALGALFVDLDFKGTPEAEARAKLDRFLIKPSVVVFSGGGLHVYWFLREPIDLQAPGEAERVKELLRRLALAVGGDLAVAEAARILRVPGTFNYKYTPARRVVIEHFNPELQYNACDFDDLLPAEPEATGNGRGFTVGERIKDGTRNDTLYKLARSEKARGLCLKASHAALRVMNAERCEPPLTEQEVEQIAHHAFEQADRPEFANGEASDVHGKPESGQSGAVITRLSDVVPESVSWAWRGYLPVGRITILEGDPGLGKSTLALDLAARVSTSAPMPDGTPTELGGVVIMSLEDGLADTIVPRLKAVGADLTRCVSLDGVGRGGKIRLPTVEDTEAIREACEEVKARMVIIDPLMGFISSKQNSWRDQDMRSALGPLAKLGEELGVAVVVIRHLNKAAGGQAIYRGGGSIGIVGAARTAFLIAKDPEADDRRIMACIKNNLAPTPPSLSFHIEGVGETSRIVWGKVSPHTADALLAVQVPQEERSALEEAKKFLCKTLAAGPVETWEVQKQARAAGIKDKTLNRAKRALGVQAKKEDFQGGWLWILAEDGQEVPKMANIFDDHLRGNVATPGGLAPDWQEVEA